jgi:hypothetical protein
VWVSYHFVVDFKVKTQLCEVLDGLYEFLGEFIVGLGELDFQFVKLVKIDFVGVFRYWIVVSHLGADQAWRATVEARYAVFLCDALKFWLTVNTDFIPAYGLQQ